MIEEEAADETATIVAADVVEDADTEEATGAEAVAGESEEEALRRCCYETDLVLAVGCLNWRRVGPVVRTPERKRVAGHHPICGRTGCFQATIRKPYSFSQD
jgi:hypothetical protein